MKKAKSSTNNRYYFTQETEEAILLYNLTEDSVQRNRIYDEHIKYAFEKLSENIIRTFKFDKFDVPYEDVKSEVISFLNEKIHKYSNPALGKAYSYFTRTVLNYLIAASNTNYDKQKSSDTTDAIDISRNVVNEVVRNETQSELSEFIDIFVEKVDKQLPVLFKRQSDIAVADSVLELFRNREMIENFNKKALYIMIRDRTGVKTQYITRVVNILKELYITMYLQFQQTGTTSIPQKYLKTSEFLS
jgi:hypothetical protein